MSGEAKVETTSTRHSTDYVITGSFEAVTAAVDRLKRSWPSAGYGTWFHWPPGQKTSDGRPLEYKKPKEIKTGVWQAFGYRSNSCD